MIYYLILCSIYLYNKYREIIYIIILSSIVIYITIYLTHNPILTGDTDKPNIDIIIPFVLIVGYIGDIILPGDAYEISLVSPVNHSCHRSVLKIF